MNDQNMIINTINPERKWIYRIGAIASLMIGILYIGIIILYATVGVPPVGGEARLHYLIGKTTTWWAIVGISVFTNFLYVLVSLSLYFTLKHINRIVMLIGIAFVILFVILENAVNWTIYGALLLLSQGYATATSESQRAIYISAATFASAVLESPLAAIWAIGTLSLGILLIGFVMLKSEFSKLTAYIGIMTGILGIIAVAGVSIAIILNALFATIWLFFVGYKLYRLSL
jgi:hypothetical protein